MGDLGCVDDGRAGWTWKEEAVNNYISCKHSFHCQFFFNLHTQLSYVNQYIDKSYSNGFPKTQSCVVSCIIFLSFLSTE